MPSEPRRNWTFAFTVHVEPVRGKFAGQLVVKRLSLGRRTAKEAWKLYWTSRGREHIKSVELWRDRTRVL